MGSSRRVAFVLYASAEVRLLFQAMQSTGASPGVEVGAREVERPALRSNEQTVGLTRRLTMDDLDIVRQIGELANEEHELERSHAGDGLAEGHRQ
jgi:hypothetical protein